MPNSKLRAPATAGVATTSGTRGSGRSRVAGGIRKIRRIICVNALNAYGSMRARGECHEDGVIGSVSVADLLSPRHLLLVEIVLVDLGEVLPLIGHRVLGKDRAHRTDRLTRAAVDALVGMDEVHVVCVRR